MRIISFIVGLIAIFNLISCKKVEGKGGTSTIKGKIIVKNYNSQGTVLEGTYPAKDLDVYIIYGDKDSTFDDDTKTSPDGSFEFPFLENGKYTIYTYEDVLPIAVGVDNKKAVFTNAEIIKKKTIVDIGTIEIKEK